MLRKIHKWFGLVLGPLVIVWFVSGMVMMYTAHPRSHKTAQGRLSLMTPIAVEKTVLDYKAAWATTELPGYPAEARLNTLMGRPAYFFRSPGHPPMVVWADTGERLEDVSPEMAAVSAASYLKKEVLPTDVTLLDVPDQWTVGTGVSSWHWPVYRIRLQDKADTLVYVSKNSAEVCQVVTRSQRLVSWLGSIPHWLYFSFLRQHRELWRQAILWLSGAGTIAAILGMVIGLQYFKWKGYGRKRYIRSSPYMGVRRWHHLLGLVFGITTILWIFSGMLSLTPFHWSSSTAPTAGEIKALEGENPAPSLFSLHPGLAMKACQDHHSVRMIEPVLLNHIPYYLCWESPSQSSLVKADGPGHPVAPFFSAAAIGDAVYNLLPEDRIDTFTQLNQYDAYCSGRHSRIRLPVMRIITKDTQVCRYYIEMPTGRLVMRYDRYAMLNRWLYKFLHCFDTPFFLEHRIFRYSFMCVTLTGGILVVLTGLWSWGVVFLRRRQ